MTLQEYKQKYAGLSSADVTRLVASDAEFRNATEANYTAYFRSELNTKCGDCWKDAYVLLMRRTPDTNMETERQFELKAGALLRDVRTFANDKLATRLNLTDELALYHLGTNPGCIGSFSKYPDNWQELAAAYIAKIDGKAEPEAAELKVAKKSASRKKTSASK